MKALRVWNDMRMSYYWQNLYFWVNYPFNYNTNIIITYNSMNSTFLQTPVWKTPLHIVGEPR